VTAGRETTATTEVVLNGLADVADAIVRRVAMFLDVLNYAIVVLVDALLQFVLFGQVDAEGAEDSPNAQTAVSAMLEGHTAIPYYSFWTQGIPASGFSPLALASGRCLHWLVLQPPERLDMTSPPRM
jgi:hypothetical protein